MITAIPDYTCAHITLVEWDLTIFPENNNPAISWKTATMFFKEDC